jgi:ribosomal protein S18 acetylase RimI-like enzyme
MMSVRPFTAGDIPLGMRLKAAANWNQTEADWRRALELEPDGCFVGVCDGVDAATLTTAVFGGTAWIAMVLTDPAFRGRGLATALLKHALAWIEGRGIASVRLDATALGRPVYEKLGFRVVGEETRYFGTPTFDDERAMVGSRSFLPLAAADIAAAGILDARSTGNDRTRLLETLRRDWPEVSFGWHDGHTMNGFVTARRGSRAVQIGPSIATDPEVGEWLLSIMFNLFRDQAVYVDVPTANVAACNLVRRRGLAVERTFFRMTLGRDVAEREGEIWANFGPEKG